MIHCGGFEIEDSDNETDVQGELEIIENAHELGRISVFRNVRKSSKLLKQASPMKIKKTSDSPKKLAKSRRNYKVLPLRDNGCPDVPVILGKGVHRTIVMEVGNIDSAPCFRRDRYLYPVGFLSKRKYFSFDADSNVDIEKAKKVYYYCRIGRSEGSPSVFHVLIRVYLQF